MGLFNRYRGHAERVGAELAAILGGTLEPPHDRDPSSSVSFSLRGMRESRSIRVGLNQMHGIFVIACEIRLLGLTSYRLTDDRSIFAAGDEPYVAERIKVSTRYDGEALWQLLPEATRSAIVEMLASESSSFQLDNTEISMMLGPLGLLREATASATILSGLDRLLAIATAVEQHWDVNPREIGTGRGGRRARPSEL